MKRFTFLLSLFITLVIWWFTLSGICTYSFASAIDGFIVQTHPESFSVNEAVDLEISAVKDGKIIKDYDGIVFIVIDGIDKTEYLVPSDGIYEFLPSDQGKKSFSKGLKIKKEGSFTLIVKEAIDKNIKGQKNIVVKTEKKKELSVIDVISPTNWGIETDDTLTIIWSSIPLPNTPIKIFLNKAAVWSAETDKNWEFSTDIRLTKTWENTLELKAFDVDNTLIGKSDTIPFTFKKETKKPLVNAVKVLPDTTVNKMSKVTIELDTREDIQIAKIILGDKSYAMDKKEDGMFTKSMVAQKAWTITVKFWVMDNGKEKIIDKQTIITVKDIAKAHTGDHNAFAEPDNSDILTWEHTSQVWITWTIYTIENILINPINIDGSDIQLTRDYSWNAKKFMVNYGIEKTTLEQNIMTDTQDIKIHWIDPHQRYYFQITPLNEEEKKNGNSSPIIEYIFWWNTSEKNTNCVISNITVKKETIDGENYLVWTASENIEKYEIYRIDVANSKTTISDMEKIGETKDTKFAYPFDFNSKEEKYAYYAIQGICKNGQKIQIGNIEKVKVGPFDNLLIILILSGLVFSMYKLYTIDN